VSMPEGRRDAAPAGTPELVEGLVLCATSAPTRHELHRKRGWRPMGLCPSVRGPGMHLAVTTHTEPFVAALRDALSEVRGPATLHAG
jgi:hypothetical protein